MSALAWVDGRFVPADAAPAAAAGLFETLGALRGRLPLFDRHVARLAASARTLGITCDLPEGLLAAACELLARTGHGDGVLRIALRADGAPRFVLTARARAAAAVPLRLWPVRSVPDASAAHKVMPRARYDDALREARAQGADDALLLDAHGAVLETAVGNVFCAASGAIVTPPADGAILPGIARAVLCAALPGLVREAPLDYATLAGARAVWVSNAVHGPLLARVVDPSFAARPATDASALAEVTERLTAAWQRAFR